MIFYSIINVAELRSRGPPQVVWGFLEKIRKGITNKIFIDSKKKIINLLKKPYDENDEGKAEYYEK
jgi:hypothetical protein